MVQTSTPQTDPPEPLSVALLLASAGGLLDGFVYVNHGHVFANAMTGNVVLLGIAAIGHDWTEVVRYLAPLGAFFAGVTASKILRQSLGRRSAIVGLSLEVAVLFAASWLPTVFPEIAFTAIIAFVSSYQITSFRRLGHFTYNSTFVTGNLREMAEALYDGLGAPIRWRCLTKAAHLLLICVCFLLGAILGALLAPHFLNHTLWFEQPFLLVVAAILTTKK